MDLQEKYKLVGRSFKHGDATPVIVGNRLFVAFCDDKTGTFTQYNKKEHTTTILDCSEVTEDCFERNGDGQIEYFGDVRGRYSIKVKVPEHNESIFYCSYEENEIVEIKEVN